MTDRPNGAGNARVDAAKGSGTPSSQTLVVPGAAQSVHLPCLFPSISSVKGDLRPLHSLQVLWLAHVPEFLISAYDIHHSPPDERLEIEELLRGCAERGATVLLDSGKYESYWRSDRTWEPNHLAEIVRCVHPTLRFCFDDQDPPGDPAAATRRVIDSCNRDRDFHSSPVVPIVHGTTKENLTTACGLVARELRPLLLAIPERELGDGILDRARTLRRIRRSMDEVAPETPIHVLGTGHPVSLLIYALFGAESFDGLEWSYSCVSPRTGDLVDFQHRDIVAPAGADPEIMGRLDYRRATLLHNLTYFRAWMARIRGAVHDGTARDLLCSMVSAEGARTVLDLESEALP